MKQFQELTKRQHEVLGAFVSLSKEHGRYPNRTEMLKAGFSRDTIRAAFGSLSALRDFAKKQHGKELEGIVEDAIRHPRKHKNLSQALRTYNRFVITSAINGHPIHEAFLATLKSYCKANDAALLILPVGSDLEEMDHRLVQEHWVLEDTTLNTNLWISSIKLSEKTANPLTGLGGIGQRDGSMIAASPKQFLNFVAVGHEKFGHAVMTTGSVTSPRYLTKSGQVRRSEYLATQDHTMGALIVEIADAKAYHFRQVQADDAGVFYDLGRKYNGKKITKSAPLAALWGDLHAGEVDPQARKAAFEQMAMTGVKRVFVGDAFGGLSINHHEEDNHITQVRLAQKDKLNLKEEIAELCRELDAITSVSQLEEVVLVDSNHHDFLSKHYLQRSKYTQDPHNSMLGHELALAMMKGANPLQYACHEVIGLKHPKKVRWLSRDEDVRVAGVYMSEHGDKGANGSKGSPRTLSNGYGRIMHGHTHSPYIFKDVYCVGTLSILRPDFVSGASSWTHTNGYVYENGMCQLLSSFAGEWTTDPRLKAIRSKGKKK